MTDLALVAEVVGQDVHLQGGGRHVLLVADVTGLGVVRCQLLVGLPMSRKVGTRGKVLTTLVALVLGFGDRVLVFGPAVSLTQRVDGESLDEVFRYRGGLGGGW